MAKNYVVISEYFDGSDLTYYTIGIVSQEDKASLIAHIKSSGYLPETREVLDETDGVVKSAPAFSAKLDVGDHHGSHRDTIMICPYNPPVQLNKGNFKYVCFPYIKEGFHQVAPGHFSLFGDTESVYDEDEEEDNED